MAQSLFGKNGAFVGHRARRKGCFETNKMRELGVVARIKSNFSGKHGRAGGVVRIECNQ